MGTSRKAAKRTVLSEFSKNVPSLGKLSFKVRRTLHGHFGKIHDLQFCPDEGSKTLVSASQDGNLIIWDALSTYKVFAIPLRGTASWVMTCSFAPGGNLVACGGLDNVCSIFDIRLGSQDNYIFQHVPPLPPRLEPLPVARFPANASSSPIPIPPLYSGTISPTLGSPPRRSSASPPLPFLSSSSSSASSSSSSSSSASSASSSAAISPPLLSPPSSSPPPLSASPPWQRDPARQQAVSTNGGRVRRELYGHSSYISCCRFADEGHIFTASGDGSTILWDVETGQRMGHYKRNPCDTLSVAIAPDHRTFVTGGCDNTATLWDVTSGTVIATYNHTSDVNAVQFFPGCFSSGSTAEGEEQRATPTCCSMGLATATDSGYCRFFDIRSSKELMTYSVNGLRDGLISLAFSRSGRLLIAGCEDGNCYAWDTLKGEVVAVLEGHKDAVSCLSFAPDGSALCSGSWDSQIKIWA